MELSLAGQLLGDHHLTLELRPDVVDGVAQLSLVEIFVERVQKLFQLTRGRVVRDSPVLTFDEDPAADEPVFVSGAVEAESLVTVETSLVVVVAVGHTTNLRHEKRNEQLRHEIGFRTTRGDPNLAPQGTLK